MYNSARVMKPKLSLSISAAQNATRPSLSLKSPSAMVRTPISPMSTASPTSKIFSSLQVPTCGYINSCSAKSILKKPKLSSPSAPQESAAQKNVQLQQTPIVYCVTPIENPDEYYGQHVKMTREERRWRVQQ